MPAPVESALAALQSRLASALLAVDPERQQLPAELFSGSCPGAAGMRVHRNTVLGALCNALRLSFVSVDRLVGEDFFDRMAVEYARAAPPQAPQLNEYGGDFATFITDYPGTQTLPYLADLARFDWQLDQLARLRADGGAAGAMLRLDGGVRLRFAPRLAVHTARYPVGALREAILAEDTATLGAIDLNSGRHCYALWPGTKGVNVQLLSTPSACLLQAVLAQADSAVALAAAAAAAAAESGAAEVAEILAREILPALFVHIEKEE